MNIKKWVTWCFMRHLDKSFQIGISPIWFHRHDNDCKLHYHFLIDVGFWFFELQIGDDEPKGDTT